ncbi:MAG: molecular chaperone HtpG [Sphaerospermopsis sp. SIO1G2]|nr:molecular chaperone HtpG [Sphaerospermopsis sp. SIO1G2]
MQAQDTQESIEFSAEISKVLQLMIHSLYTNKDIFLRELISNASDACDKLRYHALTNASLMEGDAELRITIAHDPQARTITITDTGIGMDREDLVANLGTIAKSGTEEFLGQLTGDQEKDVSLIGQFGVGFYSSFMVAEKVEVHTRKAGDTQGWLWTSAGDGRFTIAPSEDALPRGTSITLHMREEAATYLDTFKIRHIIETYSDHINVPIYQRPVTHEGTGEPELVNEGSALWTKQKSGITEEQYKEFYHHVSHSPDDPWMTLHNVIEGKTSYTNLLFIPSHKPFDLFHPERRRRVKLYVKRVFITEENIDLVPHFLRFLRGIIDSADLPLNISRETLQDNPRLKLIRESITSKVLSELKKKANKDDKGYASFWENFGAVIKEGLCDSHTPKEKILDVCRFASTTQDMTSLDAYIARKPEKQEQIFFLTADSLDAAKNSPLLEGFKKRGIEVLLLTDHVDDFWVNVVQHYKEVSFKSITRSDIDLDEIAPLDASDSQSESNNKPTDALDETSRTALIDELKASYGETVKDVRATNKLTNALACLAVDEGSMDMRMERFLMEHNQLPKRSARILEVNITHPFFTYLSSIMHDDAQNQAFHDAAQLLLDQACIIEGEAIDDPSGFALRMGTLMQKAYGGGT